MCNLDKSKKLILELGYQEKFHKVNLIHQDGQYVVDYEPCRFLRSVIETGRTDIIVDLCAAFNAFSNVESHPFSKFIESTNLFGVKLNNTTPEKILGDYESWFQTNSLTYHSWVTS